MKHYSYRTYLDKFKDGPILSSTAVGEVESVEEGQDFVL